MLQNGTVVNGVMIEKPHRLLTAMTITTQIITAVASSQYGGCTISLTALAPFVRDSYNIYVKKYQKRGLSEDSCIEFARQDTLKEIEDAVQTFNYQTNSMSTTNGQAPFLSVCMYLGETDEYKDELAALIEEFLKQRIVGMKNEVGAYVTQAFPKLLYILEEDNIHENSKYWYLTKLAAECTAKRMVPDYISEKKMLEYKIDANGNGNCYPCMGCRSFLTPYVDEDGNPKYYGRFNQGVVTINLPDIALSSNGDMNEFWKLFEERTELCHKALQCRHERLEGTLSDVAPILWQHGAYARLQKGEKIDPLLHGGYSTISLGYAGLYECVKYMTGKSHADGAEGEAFGLKVMQALNDKCTKWKKEEHIDYSLYGSPIESTTYKFAKCLKKRFGIIEGITDRDYITNSYHIFVGEHIDPFEKLRIEAKFQRLSPGGAISYCETSDLKNNIPAVLQMIQFIYDNIQYAELNTKSDYCQVCGYDGEIKIIDEGGELIWECPNCGNRDRHKMNVSRRTCGRNNPILPHYKTIEIQGKASLQQKEANLEPSYQQEHKPFQCDICGKLLKHKIKSHGYTLCNKHYKQYKKYGRFLDESPRTLMDRNGYRICGDITFIELYDKNCNVVAETMIDTEDLDRVKYTKWKLSNSGYVMNTPKYSGSNKHLSRAILNTNEFVDHINHNLLDNRKCNLRIVTRSQNQMNVSYRGVSKTNGDKFYAHIKINQKIINLGVYVFEEEALFARWYAETILFGEYRYPREKPEILPDRELQIMQYVDRRCNDYNNRRRSTEVDGEDVRNSLLPCLKDSNLAG